MRMGIYSCQDIFEVFIRIDPISLAGTNQSIEDRRGLSAAFAAQEHIVLFSYTERSQSIFAERNLRPTVILRKISFGSHSEKGMRTREILMTVIHTAKCRGRDPAEFMEEVLDIFAQDKSADISHMLIPEKTEEGKFAA